MADEKQWYESPLVAAGAFVLSSSIGLAGSVWPELIKPHHVLFMIALSIGISLFAIASINAIRRKLQRTGEESQSPLLISFEPLNPARQFWSPVTKKDYLGRPVAMWEVRVEVRNNSSATLHRVSVTVERIGQLPELPSRARFVALDSDFCDLQPGCRELAAVIYWPYQKRQAGMLAGDSAWAYGPVKITASADDVPPTTRVFDFHYDTDQMLFARD